jgi:hypothetical protein
MIVLFVTRTTSHCDQQILLTRDPRTHSIALPADKVLCINSTYIGTHFLCGEYAKATFTFSNATDRSAAAARSLSSHLSVAIASPQAETVTFTTASFPNQCTTALYYSSVPSESILLARDSQFPITNYDDRCALFHGYPHSHVAITFDTKEGHNFVVFNNNMSDKRSGVGSQSFHGTAVSVWFTSDFVTLSNFVGIETHSEADNSRAASGWFGEYRRVSATVRVQNTTGESEVVPAAAIIGSCLLVADFLVGVLGIATGAIKWQRRTERTAPTDIDARQAIMGRLLVNPDDAPQGDDFVL